MFLRRIRYGVVLALLLSLVLLPTLQTEAATTISPSPDEGTPTVPVQTVLPGVTPLPTAKQLPSPTPAMPKATAKATLKPLASPTVKPTPGPKLQPAPPAMQAPSALAVDADTGKILYAKDMHSQRPQASTTKITTALAFLSLYPNASDLQKQTVIVKGDLVGEANMGLREGEHIKLATVLLGLLTNSANESGMVLARYAGQQLAGPADPVDRFVAYMNTYALSLGMYESHYMNPHGLDQAGHYTSAYDLAIAGWWAIHNPTYLQDSQYRTGTVDGHSFYNVNTFLDRYPGAIGVKPGFTDDAGHCLVAAATNNGHTVIVVVMNDPNMATDTDSLMDYSFTLLAGKANQPVASINLGSLGIPKTVQATPKPAISSQSLSAALHVETDYTLRLAISVFVPKS